MNDSNENVALQIEVTSWEKEQLTENICEEGEPNQANPMEACKKRPCEISIVDDQNNVNHVQGQVNPQKILTKKEKKILALKERKKRKRKKTVKKGFKYGWTEKYFFALINSLPVCLICSEVAIDSKEDELKDHYTSHHSLYDIYKDKKERQKIASILKDTLSQPKQDIEPVLKKRKIGTEHGVFQDRWTEAYFFENVNDQPLCLICWEPNTILNEFDVKRHYYTKHFNYEAFRGEMRRKSILNLQEKLKKRCVENEMNGDKQRLVTYIICKKLVEKSLDYSEAKTVRDCAAAVLETVYLQSKREMKAAILSHDEVERRVSEMAAHVDSAVKEKVRSFQVFSLAVATQQETSPLRVVCVRGLDEAFNLTEEVISVHSAEEDLAAILKKLKLEYDLDLSKLCGVLDDGMEGVVTALTPKAEKALAIHCPIDPLTWFKESRKLRDVTTAVVAGLNLIREKGVFREEFRDLLRVLQSEEGNLVLLRQIEFADNPAVLRTFYKLRREVGAFASQEGCSAAKLPEQLDNCLALLVDLSDHLGELRTKMRRADQTVCDLVIHIKSFKNNLKLWSSQVSKGNFSPFPTVCELQPSGPEVGEVLSELHVAFERSFWPNGCEEGLAACSNPFSSDVDKLSPDCQVEALEMRENTHLWASFGVLPLIDFYKLKVVLRDYPHLAAFARGKLAMFGSTRLLEEFKARVRRRARGFVALDQFEREVKVALTSININFDQLIREQSPQPQTSEELGILL